MKIAEKSSSQSKSSNVLSDENIVILLNALSSEIKILSKNLKAQNLSTRESLEIMQANISYSKNYLADISNGLTVVSSSSTNLAYNNKNQKSVNPSSGFAKINEIKDKLTKLNDNIENIGFNRVSLVNNIKNIDENFQKFFEEAKKTFKNLKQLHTNFMSNDNHSQTNFGVKGAVQGTKQYLTTYIEQHRKGNRQSKSMGKNLSLNQNNRTTVDFKGTNDYSKLEKFINYLKDENTKLKKKYLDTNNEYQKFKARLISNPNLNQMSYNNLSENKEVGFIKSTIHNASNNKFISNSGFKPTNGI